MHEIFKKRRSIRQYSNREVSEEQIHNILCAAMVSPSGNHANPWEFVVVKKKETLSKLGNCGKWQSFVKDCSVGIVIIAKESDTDMWLQDCSIAGAHIYLEAANQGLGCCWANVLDGKTEEGKDREEYVREILDIPKEYRVVSIMAIGYPEKEIIPHTEDEYTEGKVHRERYK
jgi:nitroreductase